MSGGSVADTLDGGAGNDSLFGNEGNDTYIFGIGSGNDTISDGSGINTIRFTKGITPEMLRASHGGYYGITLAIDGSSDTLTIDRFRSHESYRQFKLEFADTSSATIDTQTLQLIVTPAAPPAVEEVGGSQAGRDEAVATSAATETAPIVSFDAIHEGTMPAASSNVTTEASVSQTSDASVTTQVSHLTQLTTDLERAQVVTEPVVDSAVTTQVHLLTQELVAAGDHAAVAAHSVLPSTESPVYTEQFVGQ